MATIIGITGGIGAGKSTVIENIIELNKTRGVDTYTLITDDIAKELMLPGGISYTKVVNHFGDKILNEDKTINKKQLGNIVFSDANELAKLNSFTHPDVTDYLVDFIGNHKTGLTIIESALLLESDLSKLCDYIVFIKTEYEIREDRLIKYRNYTRERVKEIIKTQKSDEYFESHSDFIIRNNNKIERESDIIHMLETI